MLAAAVLVVGCAKKAAPGAATEAPGDAAGLSEAFPDDETAAAEEPAEVDMSIGELEAQLAAYEDGLLEAGIALPPEVQQARVDQGADAGVPATDTSAGRCQRVCDLAQSICALEDHICRLADDHDQDPRYVKACERAQLDCEHAERSCEECE